MFDGNTIVFPLTTNTPLNALHDGRPCSSPPTESASLSACLSPAQNSNIYPRLPACLSACLSVCPITRANAIFYLRLDGMKRQGFAMNRVVMFTPNQSSRCRQSPTPLCSQMPDE